MNIHDEINHAALASANHVKFTRHIIKSSAVAQQSGPRTVHAGHNTAPHSDRNALFLYLEACDNYSSEYTGKNLFTVFRDPYREFTRYVRKKSQGLHVVHNKLLKFMRLVHEQYTSVFLLIIRKLYKYTYIFIP